MVALLLCRKIGGDYISKISCSVCGSIHNRNYECNAKRQAKADKSKRDRERLDNKLFSSSKWKKLRNMIMNEHDNIDLFSYYVFGKVQVASVVHHIIEALDDADLMYDWDNLISLSDYTHIKIVHMLYKTNKKEDIQNMLRDMINDWNNDKKELGSMKERYNKIVKDVY